MTAFARLADRAENSIMQTLSIAVSAILIAAGLVTAPSLILSARDTLATTDLADLAAAQATYIAESPTYADTASIFDATASGSLASSTRVRYTTALTRAGIHSAVCADSSGPHYLMSGYQRLTGHTFYRTSESARTYTDWTTVPVAGCMTAGTDAAAPSPRRRSAAPWRRIPSWT